MPTQRQHPKREPMLVEGNTHLGLLVHTFSLPAFSTCPGATFACLTVCYALGFRFYLAKNLAKHKRSWEKALDAGPFAREMVQEIKYRYVRVLRIHVAGDFFGRAYIRAWARVARSCPGVTFLFYSRSWRVPELLPALTELASLPNVYAWWSEDRDTGPSRMPVGRRCYLCVDESDEAIVPEGVDLVFRHRTKTPRKWVGPAWVCPKEQGVPHGLTCSTCRRCFVPGPMPRKPAGVESSPPIGA